MDIAKYIAKSLFKLSLGLSFKLFLPSPLDKPFSCFTLEVVIE